MSARVAFVLVDGRVVHPSCLQARPLSPRPHHAIAKECKHWPRGAACVICGGKSAGSRAKVQA